MATEEDRKAFKRYQKLYRKALSKDISYEEIMEMECLGEKLRDKIFEFIFDDEGNKIYSKRKGSKLSIPKILGCQNHHIIHVHTTTSKHAIWDKAGMHVDDKENFLSLPTKAAAYLLGYEEYPIHEGPHVVDIRKQLKTELDAALELGIQQKWDTLPNNAGQKEYRKALLRIITIEANKCLKPLYLNTTSKKSKEIVRETIQEIKKKNVQSMMGNQLVESFSVTTDFMCEDPDPNKAKNAVAPHPLVDTTTKDIVYGALKGLYKHPLHSDVKPLSHSAPKKVLVNESTLQNKPVLKQKVSTPGQPSAIRSPERAVNISRLKTQSPSVPKKNIYRYKKLYTSRLYFKMLPNRGPVKKEKSFTRKTVTNKNSAILSQFLRYRKLNTTQQAPKFSKTQKTPRRSRENVSGFKILLPHKSSASYVQTHISERRRLSNTHTSTLHAFKMRQMATKEVFKPSSKTVSQQNVSVKPSVNQKSVSQNKTQNKTNSQSFSIRSNIQPHRTFDQSAIQQARRQQQQQMQQMREQARRQQQLQLQQAREQARRQQQLQLQQAREKMRREQELQRQRAREQERVRQQQLQLQRAREQARIQQQNQLLAQQRAAQQAAWRQQQILTARRLTAQRKF